MTAVEAACASERRVIGARARSAFSDARSALAGLTRGAAQPNVPGRWWQLGYGARFWALLVPVALMSGGAGAGLKLLLHAVEDVTWSYRAGEMSNAVAATSAAHRVIALAVAGAMAGGGWWAIKKLTGSSGGELDDAIWSGEGDMPVAPSLGSSVLSMTVIAIGASIGREQPPKDTAAALTGWLARRVRLSREERCLLMACAAGAGWAAVYNMPFGGGVFAAEVLIGSLALPVIIPAVATSALATAISWAAGGHHYYYQGIPSYGAPTTLLVWAVLAGPVLGVVGLGFVWLLGAANKYRVSGNWVLIGPLVAFTALGLLSIPFPQLLGNGRDIGEDVFLGGLTPALIVALLVLKPLVTALCWGSGASGGMFTPTTAYGATAGALAGYLWSLAWPGAPAGAFALVGATAVVAAGMAAPVTAIVLMIELTGHLTTILLPVVLAVGGATLTARLLGGGSIYSVRLSLTEPTGRWRGSGTWSARAASAPLPGIAETADQSARPPAGDG